MPSLQQCWEAGIGKDQILCVWADGTYCTLDKIDQYHFMSDDYEMYLGYLHSDRDIEEARKTFLRITR